MKGMGSYARPNNSLLCCKKTFLSEIFVFDLVNNYLKKYYNTIRFSFCLNTCSVEYSVNLL